MKTKMKFLIAIAALAFSFCAPAQTNAPTTSPPSFIKGDLAIKYNTRVDATKTKGVKDVYTLNINVCDSAKFHGTITDAPLIMGGIMGNTVVQSRGLYYDLACDVVNPKNIAQTKNVGRLFGSVPVDQSGAYHYDNGTLEISVIPMGNAGGSDSRFTGIALGKPLVRPPNWMETLQRQAVSITRSVNGKTMTVVLKRYDKMEFRQVVLGGGPVASYQPVTVNGEMLYDYDKNTWFFNNVTVQYAVAGSVKIDRLSGNIRWVEDANRKVNGKGEYQFDVRVNEPPPNESTAFTATTSDESSFFEVDPSIASLSGTMKYQDTLRGDTTMASAVAIDLVGNNINKQQAMVLCKMVIFAAVIPMNAD